MSRTVVGLTAVTFVTDLSAFEWVLYGARARTVEVRLHGRGVDLRPVGEGGVGPELELERRAVLRELPTLGEHRLDLEVVVDLREAVVDRRHERKQMARSDRIESGRTRPRRRRSGRRSCRTRPCPSGASFAACAAPPIVTDAVIATATESASQARARRATDMFIPPDVDD